MATVIERCIEAHERRRQLTSESDARITATLAAVMAMNSEEREDFVAALVMRLESASTPRAERPRRKGRRRHGLRDLVTTVLSAGKPLGSGDIVHGVLALRPGVARSSIPSTILEMKKAGLLVICGQGARGALYGLPNGGAAN